MSVDSIPLSGLSEPVSKLPVAVSAFPLGVKRGGEAEVAVNGYNLGAAKLRVFNTASVEAGALDVYVTGPEGFQADLAGVFAGADFTLLLSTVIVVSLLLLITYRSPVDDTDNSSKRCMGAVQEAWFLAAVREAWSAGYQHIVVASSKKLYTGDATGRYGSGENSDTWGEYTTERDRIFGALHADGIRVTVMSGDRHTPNVVRRTVADHGAAFDCLDLCACPTGVQNNDNGQKDTTGQLWLRSSPSRYESVFGSLQFQDDGRLRMAIRDARSGLIRWGCWVAPRSNTPLYE